ncbi:CocE/NonD family hydrolase [Subtercola sp. YIM 133946]|uniref:CocE/NonD family hydrolase n=1 Tax=Subtercola sp. YIM 133946 TaxID=3118909 RepID=UPI002F958874
MFSPLRIEPGPLSELATQKFVRMRDGVRLATDVYLPGGDVTPGETILIRLPYDKNGEYTFIPPIAAYMMGRGYRVVAQDVRGKFRSEGETLLMVNEAADGYDTIEWITQQEWSNGRVAMWGDSYYGFTQWAAVSSQHPALRAISPRVTGTQLGEPVVAHPGDVTRRVDWAVTLMYPLTFFHSNPTYHWDLDWSKRPFTDQIEAFLAQVGQRSISYDQWYPHPVHLRRFPFGSPFEARAIPVLQTIGWWDNCAPLSWADVAEIERRPAWASNHYLRIESIDHESYGLLDRPESRVSERSPQQIEALLPGMLDPALDFFEVFVRDNGDAGRVPRVAWNLAGEEGMRTSPSWPPTGVRPVTLRAEAGGTLAVSAAPAESAAEGTAPVTPAAPGALAEPATVVAWLHDAADPVPSSVENSFAFLLDKPDEAALGRRADVIVYESAPLATHVELVGPAHATAMISSTGPSMDLFVRLLDVDEQGGALRIARGQVHLVHATTPTSVTIDLTQLGYRLDAGHRLRVHLSSSDSPEFLPQPGTGADPWSAVDTTPNTQSLTIGGPDGFSLTLSVLHGDLS